MSIEQHGRANIFLPYQFCEPGECEFKFVRRGRERNKQTVLKHTRFNWFTVDRNSLNCRLWRMHFSVQQQELEEHFVIAHWIWQCQISFVCGVIFQMHSHK